MKVNFAIKAAAISSGNVLTLPPVASGDIGGRAADIVGRGRFYAIHARLQCAGKHHLLTQPFDTIRRSFLLR